MAYNAQPDLGCGRIDLTTWFDPVIDDLGHDPRSDYAATFWLPVVGPSTLWFARFVVNELESCRTDELVPIDVADAAASLGLSWNGGRNSPFARTVGRAIRFGFAKPLGDHTLAVRRRLAPLNQRQLDSLPRRLKVSHRRWEAPAHPPREAQKPSTSSSRVRTPKPVPPFGQIGEASSVAAGPAISR